MVTLKTEGRKGQKGPKGRKGLFTQCEVKAAMRNLFSTIPIAVIRVIGVIVPRRLRADWRQEWEAELRYRAALLADWDRLDWSHKFNWHCDTING